MLARRNGRYWKFKRDEVDVGITSGTVGKEYRIFRKDEFPYSHRQKMFWYQVCCEGKGEER